MPKKVLVDEFQAATIVGMSPELLAWLTRHSVKTGSSRKLQIDNEKDDVKYFDVEELKEYDKWLKQPWPRTEKQSRPHVPTGIRREIKNEASGECAICNRNANSCEAAHIEPVSKSRNNHPHNLLWLCKNHHKKFDSGLYGPDDENKEFVVHQKQVIHRFMRIRWRDQAEIRAKHLTASQRLSNVVDLCAVVESRLGKTKSQEQTAAVQRQAVEAVELLAQAAPVPKDDTAFAIYDTISSNLSKTWAKSKTDEDAESQIRSVSKFRDELRRASGLIDCPLCSGTGSYQGYDCPVCDASGTVNANDHDIDLSPYKLVKCPLCEGTGSRNGADCPECGGNGEMEQRFADRVDVADYRDVECPVCEGSGTHNGRDCPVCDGNGQIERWLADRTDARDYRNVTCPLCRGSGKHNDSDCPECGGNGELERRHAEKVDVGDYGEVTCPVCQGGGRDRYDRDCPVCGGNGSIEKRHLESIDLSEYKLVTCPRCDGSGADGYGGDCRACGGEGEVERRHVDSIKNEED